jgi:thiopurine S-methyltransferase
MSAEVVGVEGIQTALEDFAKEQPELKVENKGCQDGFERFEGNKISLLRGDYFDLDSTKTNGTFGAIYDRASMVAIQPDLRKSYVDVLGKLIAPQGKILLLALDRRSTSEEARKKGPPFSIPEETVRELYEGLDWVESVTLLEQSDQLEKKPEDRERYPDLDQLLELVYMIQAK